MAVALRRPRPSACLASLRACVLGSLGPRRSAAVLARPRREAHVLVHRGRLSALPAGGGGAAGGDRAVADGAGRAVGVGGGHLPSPVVTHETTSGGRIHRGG